MCPKEEKKQLDNHSNQLNPVDEAYWKSRGYDKRPENCEKILEMEEKPKKDTPKS